MVKLKKLNVSFEKTNDATGYLFSLVKCLSAALRHGGYEDYADDIIASSGFAFRMWAAPDLCPSAMSIWEFNKQKPWVENGGLTCDYVERLWGQESIEEERRVKGIKIIKHSIDCGTAAVAWDISGCEWGLIIGYDDDSQTLYTLRIDGSESEIPYNKLGNLDLPILSVLTVIGKNNKQAENVVADTKQMALNHLQGMEWCDNAKGIAAYDTLITIVDEKFTEDLAWNLEYYLGTYAALKWHAWKFFEKYKETELSGIYEAVYTCWQNAFDILKKNTQSAASDITRKAISGELRKAKSFEEKAMQIFKQGLQFGDPSETL